VQAGHFTVMYDTSSSGAVCSVSAQEFTLTPTQYGVPYSRPR
jgi:hypothetical protein